MLVAEVCISRLRTKPQFSPIAEVVAIQSNHSNSRRSTRYASDQAT